MKSIWKPFFTTTLLGPTEEKVLSSDVSYAIKVLRPNVSYVMLSWSGQLHCNCCVLEVNNPWMIVGLGRLNIHCVLCELRPSSTYITFVLYAG